MKAAPQIVIIAIGLFGSAVGIHATYEKYQGSGLSRVPSAQPLQAAAATTPVRQASALPATAAGTGLPLSDDGPLVAATQRIRPDSLSPDTEGLTLYPSLNKGMRTPFDLWRYYGRATSSFSSPVLPMRWDQWQEFHHKQKPGLMKDVRSYMERRYDFHGEAITGHQMSGGKPVMRGPVARVPKKVASFEELGALSPDEIKRQGPVSLQAARPPAADRPPTWCSPGPG